MQSNSYRPEKITHIVLILSIYFPSLGFIQLNKSNLGSNVFQKFCRGRGGVAIILEQKNTHDGLPVHQSAPLKLFYKLRIASKQQLSETGLTSS